MKKTLLLSTALVAFAGMAVADVALTGRAEVGIFGGTDDDTDFFTDIDVTFTMSGETDGGLSFGASVDLDEGGDGSDASDNNDEDGGATIFVSGGFGTVTVGDTNGAMDWALMDGSDVGNPGTLNDDETTHAGFFGDFHDGVYDNQIARYDYSFGDFGVALSMEMDDDSDGAAHADLDTGYALGVRYSSDMGGFTLNAGLAYQVVDLGAADGDQEEIVGLSVGADMTNGLSAGISYVSGDVLGVEDSSHTSIGLGYTTGALSLHANYGAFDFDGAGADPSGYGLAVAYDLGGGAVVHAGYGNSDLDIAGVDNTDTFSLGLGLSF